VSYKMESYSYKPSGIEWLGEIPEHWKRTRLVSLGKFTKGSGISKSEIQEEGISAILYGDIYTKYDIKTGLLINKISTTTALKSTEIFKGDLLLTGSGETKEDIGKCVVYDSDEKAYAGGDVIIFRPDRADSLFLSFVLNSELAVYQKIIYSKGDIVVHIYGSKLRNIYFPLPPLQEQKYIAEYLDQATSKLDRTIELKKAQLVKIEANYFSKLQEVTTKGLNTSIKRQLVDSIWIKEVPEHWKVKRVKRVCNIFRGKFTHRPRNDPRYYGGEYPFIQTGNVSNSKKYIESYSQTLNELGLSVSQMFPSGTLCMTIAANIGDLSILKFDACFPDSIVGFSPNSGINLDFLYYQFEAIKQDFYSTAIITTQMNLNIVRIGNVFCYMPPLEEQEEIVKYIANYSEKIEKQKLNIHLQIEVLKAYRKSLIHECVTGNKQVCDAYIEE